MSQLLAPHLPNTPRKNTSGSLNVTLGSLDVTSGSGKLSASQIGLSVQEELGNNQMTTDTSTFLEKIIPVDKEKLQSVFDHLVVQEIFVGGRWKGLPTTTQHTGLESTLYDPFVKIANKISEFAENKGWLESGQIRGLWVNCNSSAPESQETLKSAIRPDCALVSTHTDKDILISWNKHSMETRSKNANVEPYDKVRWLQMLTAVEIKPKATPDETEKALMQLCSYAREIFRHQADRCFVIGLTLCANKLKVYLFDRSGVLGINEEIDINQEPERFVHVLLAFSVLHAEDLGWDLTMKLYYSPERKSTPVPSFTFPWKRVEKSTQPFIPQWTIEFDKTVYVTIRTLSTIHAQVMCGRATLVWEVCKLSDFQRRDVNGVEILVIKQSWQRLSGRSPPRALNETPLEQYVCEKAQISTGRIRGAEYVRTRKDTIVSTKSSTRHDAEAEAKPLRRLGTVQPQSQDETTLAGQKRKRDAAAEDGPTNPSKMSVAEARMRIWELRKDTVFVERRLTRILMERRGHKLIYFESYEEYLLTLSNTIMTHKACYDAGVLHRDISPNNIIIRHASQQTENERGDLIDFDHSKITEIFKTWKAIRELGVPENLDSEANLTQLTLLTRRNITLSLATIKRAFDTVGYHYTTPYLTDIVSRFPSCFSPAQDGFEFKNFNLKEPDAQLPYFSPDDVGFGQRTGTPAYISHKITETSNTVHDAVHDMESLLWVVIHFAMTQRGPGNVERSKFKDLKNIVFDWFESPKSVGLKESIFLRNYENSFKTFQTCLVATFHPNFRKVEPLRKMVIEWWKTIHTALEFQGFELMDIHLRIDSIIQETLRELRKLNMPEDLAKLTERERNRRKRLDEAFVVAFKEQRMVLIEDVEEDPIPEDDPDDFGMKLPEEKEKKEE